MQSNAKDRIFVIEVCANCKDHHWNTRHDEAKYNKYYNDSKSFTDQFIERLLIKLVVSLAIVERVPYAIIMRNQIPKSYLDFDLYCNLIPNEND